MCILILILFSFAHVGPIWGSHGTYLWFPMPIYPPGIAHVGPAWDCPCGALLSTVLYIKDDNPEKIVI